jgi:surface antigen
MRHARLLAGALALGVLAAPPPAGADPWKDESGHGRRGWEGEGPPPWARGGRDRDKDRGYVYVPPGALDLDLRCNRELVGSVLGGALGGVLGSQVGEGAGRVAATVGGAAIGVLVGGAIGRWMDEADYACVAQALEYAPGDRTVVWRGPDAGVRYELQPLRTWQDEAGRTCREYVTTAVIDGRVGQERDAACRLPEGGWRRLG